MSDEQSKSDEAEVEVKLGKALVGALVVALLVLIAAPALGHAAAKAKTTLLCCSIFDAPDPDGINFIGQIKSSSEDCLDDRKVKLYRVASSGKKLLGSASTAVGSSADGKYEGYIFNVEDVKPKTGEYYVTTKETTGCNDAKSKKITLDKNTLSG